MTELPEACEAGSFDAIVSNPPFGVRLGRGMNFHTFYSRFLDVAHHLLRPGGLLVLLAWKRGIVERANRPLDRFRRNHVRVVETGGIYPRIYVLQRRDTGS
jgi:tRNA (guanine6-N2)-methyltransferase